MNIGQAVRIYYDDDLFDEGEIVDLDGSSVLVDFYDWIERWPSGATFNLVDLTYTEGKTFLVPTTSGDIIKVFSPKRD